MHVLEPMLSQNVNSISVFGHVHSISKIKTERIIMSCCESELPPLNQASQRKDTKQ